MGQDRAQQMLGALAHQLLNHFGAIAGNCKSANMPLSAA